MAEFSMLWETVSGVGDGVAGGYTQDNANLFFRDFSAVNFTGMGVLAGIDNELAVSGTASPLSVATGKAMVYGFRYENTAVLSLLVPAPLVGDTGKRVVVRVDWALNTVRVRLVSSADGTAAVPALTQTAGTTWEIGLASFVQDTAGAIWRDASKTEAGVTSSRSFSLSPTASLVRLRRSSGTGLAATIDWRDIQQDLTSLLIVAYMRSTGPGTVNTVTLTLNNDSAANYDRSVISGQNAAVTHATGIGTTSISLGSITAIGGVANAYDMYQIELAHYANAVQHKVVQSRGMSKGAGAATDVLTNLLTGWWRQTAAINRITLTLLGGGAFTTDSLFNLYGVR